MIRSVLAAILLSLAPIPKAGGQTAADETRVRKELSAFFRSYHPEDQKINATPRLTGCDIDRRNKKITILTDKVFASQDFTPQSVGRIYGRVGSLLPPAFRKYDIEILADGTPISQLVPNSMRHDKDKTRQWGGIRYKGSPWTKNLSSPIDITEGLENRHLSLWASHGKYYDVKSGTWKWQRPRLFGTTEDVFSLSVVGPYLIPMLENAGATVFTPRERDVQKNERIVDNDDRRHGIRYIEIEGKHSWASVKGGFANIGRSYKDGENPFSAGTSKFAATTKRSGNISFISYQPDLPAEGRYAVYVSYRSTPESIDDARYTVWHKGEKTEISVNQQMGGGTWVYIGTFDFDKGCNQFNRVVVSNFSRSGGGIVSTDAVRFGGGMGNIEREGTTSGLPRCLEGARYNAQWSGMPYEVYSPKNGTDDYRDDINSRSLVTNYVGGGSCYMPGRQGLNVPIEMSLAIHSDAGFDRNGTDLIGSLSICTTGTQDGTFTSGLSRKASRDLASSLLSNIAKDIRDEYGRWTKREVLDKNYSETRLPEVPSAIVETMSHQNFQDMRLGQDPNFKFTFARSIYKSIVRHIADTHGKKYTIAPLAPKNFRIELSKKGRATLRWSATDDPHEPSAKPSGYIVYTAVGTAGFDNGTLVRSNEYQTRLEPGILYTFKIAAANKGGKSFDTEELCALYNPEAEATILVVNGFHRLAAPQVVNNATQQGFHTDGDPGVVEGRHYNWVGRQTCFNRQTAGQAGEDGLGWTNSDFEGMLFAGNEKNYVPCHARAIAAAGAYNIVSCSSGAIDNLLTDLDNYRLIDLILGMERNDAYSLKPYKTFSETMRNCLQLYTSRGGCLLVSGAYVASDMQTAAERNFMKNVLKTTYAGTNHNVSGVITGLGTELEFHNSLNEEHYAATKSDILSPLRPAFTAMQYHTEMNAAVAYKGNDYRCFTMGIPFECIKTSSKRNSIMRGILNFLLK